MIRSGKLKFYWMISYNTTGKVQIVLTGFYSQGGISNAKEENFFHKVMKVDPSKMKKKLLTFT